jgi:hypothetical protein
VAPVRPRQLRLAALRAAADELRERVASFREHSAAGRITGSGILVDELTIGGEYVRVVEAVVPAGIDTVGVAVG